MPYDKDTRDRPSSSTLERSSPRRTSRRTAADQWNELLERLPFGFWAPPVGPFRHGRPSATTSTGATTSELMAWRPEIDCFHRGDEFIVRADLPGIEKKDITVEIEDDALVIEGDRTNEREEQREGYYTSERHYGHFYRVVPLPDGAIADSVKATFKDGVLEVAMKAPPQDAARGRRIEIG
jgi:HSP20 family protein